MRDISLHLLDIAENSVRAEARLIEIIFTVDTARDQLSFVIRDDGKGMAEELLERVTSPFATTRTERPVGLGIPLLQANARQSGGDVLVSSKMGEGTMLNATFGWSSIDRPPLGDLIGTMVTLISSAPFGPEYAFRFSYDGREATLDTRTLREVLGPEVPLNLPDVLTFIQTSLREEFDQILPLSVESMEGISS